MSKTPKSSAFRKKGERTFRKPTMTSRTQSNRERRLVFEASGVKSLQERAKSSHARIWAKQEIRYWFTAEYLQEQLEKADRLSIGIHPKLNW